MTMTTESPRLTPGWTSSELGRWIGLLCEPGDRVAVTLIAPGCGVQERIRLAREVTGERFVAFLRYANAHGHGVYACPNPLRPDSESRRRSAITVARSIWLDVDKEADAVLRRIESALLPRPTLVVRTSPGKAQLVWRLADPVDPEATETVMRRLSRSFGCDRAATDASRLLRLPGFVNTKYPGPVTPRIVRILAEGDRVRFEELAKVVGSAGGERRTGVRSRRAGSNGAAMKVAPVLVVPCPEVTREIAAKPDLLRAWRGENPVHWRRVATASERDLYLAQRLLRAGVTEGRVREILAASPNRARGLVKSDMDSYLARTIRRARSSNGGSAA